MYLPALIDNYDLISDYQSKNLSSIVTGKLNAYVFPGWWDRETNDYSLAWEMETARIIVRGQNDAYNVHTSDSLIQVPPMPMQVPLWRWDDSDGGRPLLAISSGPFLYPFTWIYYSFNLSYFTAFHFWLALLGTILLSTYFPQKFKLFARPVLLFLVALYLPQIRFDYEASWAWWLVGLALAPTLAGKRFFINLVSLSFIFAMLWLAVGTPTSFALIISLAICWFLLSVNKNSWKVFSIARTLTVIFLAIGLGTLLAGPQLFPRLFDRMEDYQLPPAQTPIYLPSTVYLNSVTRVGQTEMVYNLTVAGGSSPLQLVIPERYDTGWTAEYRLSSNSSNYLPIPLTSTVKGWRSLTIPPIAQPTTLQIRTFYNPASFRVGVWCFLAAILVWLFISGSIVVSWLGLVYTRNYNMAKENLCENEDW